MWRYISVHKRGTSEWLNDAMARIFSDHALRERAQAKLRAIAAQEPLFAAALTTPQSPPYHAEGPTLSDHLTRMLVALYALTQESLHVIDIEEFRRMKGFEGELDEMEDMIKEYVALFEVFVLCHDLGKWTMCSFESPPHSRGRELGFHMSLTERMDAHASPKRAALREAYQELYARFAKQHPALSSSALQQLFFETYQIRVRYPWHEHAIHTPLLTQLCERVSAAHGLTDRDLNLVKDLIAWHMRPLQDFRDKVNAPAIETYIAFAKSRRYDADDFLDLLQGAEFMDKVCGSQKTRAHGLVHESTMFEHFLRAEHSWSPERMIKRGQARLQRAHEAENQAFKKAGLDGVALLSLLGMSPGPAFGRVLKMVQESILWQAPLPAFGKDIDAELAKRVDQFYQQETRV